MILTAPAKKMNLNRSDLSLLLAGKRKAGAGYARKIAAYLSRSDWQTFYHLPGQELRALLMASAHQARPV